MIYAGGDKHEKGVGLMLDADMAKCVLGYWTVSERVLMVKLQGQPFNISVIVVYAPTAESTEEEIDAFYDKLEEAKSQCKSDEIQLIMGDLNAKCKVPEAQLGIQPGYGYKCPGFFFSTGLVLRKRASEHGECPGSCSTGFFTS
ncbi:craniofacial development protein 2-like [Amphiura filiformis]|uniref:craniofacial development protein 2-like n=1 Tax=Amphiura filiformis TaxID=82378 RepID=UPI003B21F865